MRYYKQIQDNYIIAIGTGYGSEEITEAEYNELMAIIQNAPRSDGKGYKLRTDLTWEEYDLPPVEETDEPLEYDEILEALADAEYELCLWELGIHDDFMEE